MSHRAVERLPLQQRRSEGAWSPRPRLCPRKEKQVLTIKCVSEKPCFICNGREKTVEVSFDDRTFKGVLCLTHVYDKLKPEVPRAAGQSSGKPA